MFKKKSFWRKATYSFSVNVMNKEGLSVKTKHKNTFGHSKEKIVVEAAQLQIIAQWFTYLLNYP